MEQKQNESQTSNPLNQQEPITVIKPPIEAPQIEDTIAKAKNAMAMAVKVKQKVVQTWFCTECNSPGIQLHYGGAGHFHVHLEDGMPVGEDDEPLQDRELNSFNYYKHKRGM